MAPNLNFSRDQEFKATNRTEDMDGPVGFQAEDAGTRLLQGQGNSEFPDPHRVREVGGARTRFSA